MWCAARRVASWRQAHISLLRGGCVQLRHGHWLTFGSEASWYVPLCWPSPRRRGVRQAQISRNNQSLHRAWRAAWHSCMWPGIFLAGDKCFSEVSSWPHQRKSENYCAPRAMRTSPGINRLNRRLVLLWLSQQPPTINVVLRRRRLVADAGDIMYRGICCGARAVLASHLCVEMRASAGSLKSRVKRCHGLSWHKTRSNHHQQCRVS